jgi:beta-lactam-binding protein with PASTA domain
VKGKTVADATSVLTGAGFTVSPDTVFVIDSSIPAGNVLGTNPPFGQSAKQGTDVILTVSKSPDQVSVPDVTGQTTDAAKAALAAAPYLFDVTVTSEPNATIPVDTVLRTDPAVNTPVAPGSKINVIVSAGPAKVRVPPVEGLTEAAARNQLTTKGLVANVVYVTLATGSPDDGHVISQSIPPTDSVVPGTTITLKVGKAAPAPTTTTAPPTTTIAPTTTPVPSADLSITSITHSTSPGSVTFKVTVTNNGPVGVTSATITDSTSGGAGGVSWTCNSSGGANCPPLGDSHAGNINAAVDLPVGGTVVFNITITSGSNLTNSANISSPVSDPDLTNNSKNDGPVSVV